MGPGLKAGVKDMYNTLRGNGLGAYFDDMLTAEHEIKMCALTGALSCFVFLMLASCFPGLVVWLCVIVTQAGLCGLAFVFYKEGADASDDAKSIALKLKAGLNSRANMFLYAAVTTGLFAVIFAISVCCNIQHFSRATKIIDLAADFLMDTKRLLVVPIIQFALQLAVISIWAGGYASVMSMNNITVDPLIPQGRTFEW
jgi:hypothetical protein